MIPHSKPFIHPDDIKAVVKVLESGMRAGGNKVLDFESALAAYINRRFAAAVSSGTAAFYATKIIAAGEGGMVLSDNRDLIERVRDIVSYADKPDDVLRFNFKMTDMAAALGLSQLGRLDPY